MQHKHDIIWLWSYTLHLQQPTCKAVLSSRTTQQHWRRTRIRGFPTYINLGPIDKTNMNRKQCWKITHKYADLWSRGLTCFQMASGCCRHLCCFQCKHSNLTCRRGWRQGEGVQMLFSCRVTIATTETTERETIQKQIFTGTSINDAPPNQQRADRLVKRNGTEETWGLKSDYLLTFMIL